MQHAAEEVHFRLLVADAVAPSGVQLHLGVTAGADQGFGKLGGVAEVNVVIPRGRGDQTFFAYQSALMGAN